jgi:hypothetical protein
MALLAPPAAGQRVEPPRLSLISEYSLVAPIVPPAYTAFPTAAELGVLMHVGDGHGVGWTLLLDLTRASPLLGTGPRYRRWLGHRLAADVGAAMTVVNDTWARGVVQTGISYADIVGLTARAGFGGQDAFDLGIGAQVGRGPGMAAGALTAMALVVGGMIVAIQWRGAVGL